MNNYFIKKFFPQLGGWIITTILLEIITWSYLPQLVNSFLCTLQESPYLSSFVVFIISFLLYVFYVMFRFASEFYHTYCEDVKNIDNILRDCYLGFVIDDRKTISGRVQDLQSASGGDLLWETHGLALDNICKKEDCKLSWPFKNYFELISARRRKRMIRISLSFLNWRTNTCFAVETHLKDIICNQQKFNADCKYREDQIKELNKKLTPFKLNIKRIVIIKEDDWNFLKEHCLQNLKQYLQWHVTNHWNAILCINNDNTTPLTLSSVWQLGNNAYNDFSDFVIIKKWHDDKLIVFAQNSAEHARIVYEKTDDGGGYFNWFNDVWNQGLTAKTAYGPNEYHQIDQSFINNNLSN